MKKGKSKKAKGKSEDITWVSAGSGKLKEKETGLGGRLNIYL